ncbi:MAG: radical SAM protein [Myxococcota bacterium]|nr:radical SAM protein [Myxococcota bacterium]
MSLRVAFVSGNREQLPDPVIPLGLLSLAANTPSQHPRTLIDLCFEDAPEAALGDALEAFAPDVVALGMRNIQAADYSGIAPTVEYYAGLIQTIRRHGDAAVVLGGSGFSVMPGALMERLQPDFGIAGEAEAAFPALLAALEAGGDPLGVAGLWRLANGTLERSSAKTSFLDLNQLAPPDRHLADSRYYTEVGIEGIQTKRGCPLRCEYCTYPTIEGRVGRLRDPVRVADEWEKLAANAPNLHHIFIVDSVFNLPTRHAREVCDAVAQREIGIPWTCYINPLGFDEALAEAMARAGCAGMEVGADSGSDQQLTALRKGFTTDAIRTLSRTAKATGLLDCHTFLLGTPGESFDDVLRTLEFVADLDPFGAILMVWVDDAEALDPELARQRQALREKVLLFLEDHRDDYPWWAIPSLGVNYHPDLFSTLRAEGLHGPLWQHLRGPAATRLRERRRLRTQASA